MALTTEQSLAFAAWLESEHLPTDAIELARAAFEEGLRVADRADILRYEAQYARRFGGGEGTTTPTPTPPPLPTSALSGARLAERRRRETPAVPI